MAASITEVGLGLLAGSLSTLSPCVFPLLPLVVGGALQNNRLAPVAMGGAGTMAVAFLWSRWFPELRTARRLDGRS